MAKLDTFDTENTTVLVNLVVDPMTSDALRVRILNKLLEGTERDNFFSTVYEEKFSLGSCPHCEHTNHWMIPEEELNRMGWFTHEQDDRVSRVTKGPESKKPHPEAKTCDTWEEACHKKKITI